MEALNDKRRYHIKDNLVVYLIFNPVQPKVFYPREGFTQMHSSSLLNSPTSLKQTICAKKKTPFEFQRTIPISVKFISLKKQCAYPIFGSTVNQIIPSFTSLWGNISRQRSISINLRKKPLLSTSISLLRYLMRIWMSVVP